jgi:hypothetical protein
MTGSLGSQESRMSEWDVIAWVAFFAIMPFAVRWAARKSGDMAKAKACEHCGKLFDPQMATQKFCSGKCRRAARLEKRRRGKCS